jgi:HupE / UreJ protein
VRPQGPAIPRLLAWAIVAIWAALATTPALAHTRSESQSLWEIGADKVDLVMTFAEAETAPLAKAGQPVSDELLKAYLVQHMYPLADGRRCRLIPPVETLSAVAGFHKFDLSFACGAHQNLQIHSDAFSDRTPSHTNFAQVQNASTGEFTEQLITRDRATLNVSGEGGELKEARFLDFIRMGVMHIFTGVDHMSFLLGLVLISPRLKDLVFVVTGFTLGHSLTLALAVTGVLRPHAEYIDALVALTIALIGAENTAVATGRPAGIALAATGSLLLMAAARLFGIGDLPAMLLAGAGLFTGSYLMISGSLPDFGRLRMVITVVFGLIHGFGFASNLLEMQLPTGRIAELLVGFNLGVEIGQMTLVLSATLLVLLLARLKLALPRPIVVEVCSGGLMLLGTYWFATRSFV